MALLCLAWFMVRWLPFRYWRFAVGQIGPDGGDLAGDAGASSPWRSGSAGQARRLAVHVERGAARLPFATKCLPRAMVLCWLLRTASIAYVLKIAARPAAARSPGTPDGDDDLHAWVESAGRIVIGDLPGPWLVVLILQG